MSHPDLLFVSRTSLRSTAELLEPANALTTVLVWWTANIRWAGYRAGEVVGVIEALRAGGAVVGDRDRQLAAEAGVGTVISALEA